MTSITPHNYIQNAFPAAKSAVKRERAYIHPGPSKGKKRTNNITNNPYISHFVNALDAYHDFVNKDSGSSRGVFDIIFHLRKIDILFLNWIEDVPDRKLGYLQALLFLLVLQLKDLLKIKVIWTLHNKESHYPQNKWLKKILIKQLIAKSNLIITHAREGIDFAASINPSAGKKIFYFGHPIIPVSGTEGHPAEKIYDILIWGALTPYKGIDHFLGHLSKSNAARRYTIHIVGKANPPEYYHKLASYANPNITIENRFAEKDELHTLIKQSKIVLFPYSSDSVLSSGALIDTLALHASIIGPDTGAFKEVGKMGLIETFDNYAELMEIIHKELLTPINKEKQESIRLFIEGHTWEIFAEELFMEMDKHKVRAV